MVLKYYLWESRIFKRQYFPTSGIKGGGIQDSELELSPLLWTSPDAPTNPSKVKLKDEALTSQAYGTGQQEMDPWGDAHLPCSQPPQHGFAHPIKVWILEIALSKEPHRWRPCSLQWGDNRRHLKRCLQQENKPSFHSATFFPSSLFPLLLLSLLPSLSASPCFPFLLLFFPSILPSTIHPFIQQAFIMHLLCPRNAIGPGHTRQNKTKSTPSPSLHSSQGAIAEINQCVKSCWVVMSDVKKNKARSYGWKGAQGTLLQMTGSGKTSPRRHGRAAKAKALRHGSTSHYWGAEKWSLLLEPSEPKGIWNWILGTLYTMARVGLLFQGLWKPWAVWTGQWDDLPLV